MLEGFFVECLEGNEAVFSRAFSDAELSSSSLSGEVYRRIMERGKEKQELG